MDDAAAPASDLEAVATRLAAAIDRLEDRLDGLFEPGPGGIVIQVGAAIGQGDSTDQQVMQSAQMQAAAFGIHFPISIGQPFALDVSGGGVEPVGVNAYR